ncbi:lariat debranching enzyme A [Phymastichus coffea]|uniref:lariat debranching enzyme A n=1 Tax=Phymastichus coffea TaxID=108790 RepID=UPI00273C6D95|nr:lariat debranching enzyme A [Phymastichus coffea]
MRIAVEGCAHGELEIIYNIILESEKKDGKKVDLLLCCGDFQSTRNWKDLRCMNVPDKYKDMGTFYKYYTGEKVAPCLTIFIGGNHEASNYLQELAYGGWVAPNIYYLGYAGVINVAGIRIAGMSGIFKSHDYYKGHYEYPPYNDQSIRSCYHVRNLEVFRLKQLSGNIDAFMSHDWPTEITDYGNVKALLRQKSFFSEDIQNKTLGNPRAMELLKKHYPSYWFSAHLHCKFAAIVPNENNSTKQTKFLALDKCLPKRKFLQILEVEHDESLDIKLSYDLEWLAILYLTNHLLSVKSTYCYMPQGESNSGRIVFTPTPEEKEKVHRKFNYDLTVPLNFKASVEVYNPDNPNTRVSQPNLAVNDQTTEFCNKVGIDDPFALLKIANNIIEDENKSNETSFSSSKFNDSSNNLSFSTEEDDDLLSFVIDTTPSYYPISAMTPLKLPAAKNDSASFDDSESSQKPDRSVCSNNSRKSLDDLEKETSVESKDLSSSSILTSPLRLPPPKNANDSFENNENSQDQASQMKSPRRSIDKVENESLTERPNSEPKKFKRRNQSIYLASDS